MNPTENAGPTAQIAPSRVETLLETGLAEVSGAVAALLADARAIDPAQDEYGHARSRAYTDAVALLKVSARLGHTVAELRGTKFEHNINVTRRDARTTPAWGSDADEQEDPPDWDFRKYKGHDYDPSVRFLDDKVFVRGLGKMHVPDDWDEERWKAGLPQKWEEEAPLAISEGSNGNSGQGNPPPISEGSNGNFEAAEAAVPRIRSL